MMQATGNIAALYDMDLTELTAHDLRGARDLAVAYARKLQEILWPPAP
jgi:hypothetical protein